MPDTAYAVFFLAVLLGSAQALYFTLKPEWLNFVGALRGELPDPQELPPTAGKVHVWERHQPILQPVVINICRI